MKRIFHFLVVSCLSVLLLFGTAAKEAVHLFAQHEDTIDNPFHICPKGEAHFEHEHHHCSFLHFVLEPFSADNFYPSVFECTTILYNNTSAQSKVVFIPYFVPAVGLRGPPQIDVTQS